MIIKGHFYDEFLFIRDREDGKIHKVYYNTLGHKFATTKHDFEYEMLMHSMGDCDGISSCSDFIIHCGERQTQLLIALMGGRFFPARIRVLMMLEWIGLIANNYDKRVKNAKKNSGGVEITIENGIKIIRLIMTKKDEGEIENLELGFLEFFEEMYLNAYNIARRQGSSSTDAEGLSRDEDVDEDLYDLMYNTISALDFTGRAVSFYTIADESRKQSAEMGEVNENLEKATDAVFSSIVANKNILKRGENKDFEGIVTFTTLEKMIKLAFEITKAHKKEL